MYLQHWGLQRSPFATTAYGHGASADGRAPYPTRPLTEAAARADYLVSQRRRLGVLAGGPGWGKTTTLAAIVDEQRRAGVHATLIDAVGLTSREFLFRVAVGLDASPDAGDCQMRLWRRVEDALAENRWQQIATFLAVDDVEALGPDSQQQLARLARLEADPAARWTILLATAPDQLDRLNGSLLQLADLRVDLARWSLDDTIGYVQTALIDEGRFEPIFTDAALDRLHEAARGVPRNVARLADFALLAGAAERVARVDVEAVERARAETKWASAGMAIAG